MKNKRVTKLSMVLMVIIMGLVSYIGFLKIEIRKLRNNISSLAIGYVLPKLNLVSLDNSPIDQVNISEGVTILLIFKSPCSACNANLSSWKNIARFFRTKVNILGIVRSGNQDAAKLLEIKDLNFPLFMPIDDETFNKQLHIKSNHAQTIIIHNNKIKLMKTGQLSGADLDTVVTTIKKLIAVA